MSASAAAAEVSASTSPLTRSLASLRWDNFALRELPIDPITEIYPRRVVGAVFSRVRPAPVEKPEVVVVSRGALASIDIDVTDEDVQSREFAEYFSGNAPIPGTEPAAHCYCGHQFGAFSGQLGDGATMYLGQVRTKRGDIQEIQFKGAGKTPYSRSADGRKVLRSSIREFLCSEAMAALGVPTTRAGTVVTSRTMVERDLFYTGDPVMERATVITRIAPTFLRFGSFEICKPRDPMTGRDGPNAGSYDILRTLLHFTCERYFPHIHAAHSEPVDRWYHMLREITASTARLVAAWQAFGWCHGVLNTDNMSILGLTLDYGPYGWMDRFDPEYICNASDNSGRYSYDNQPGICGWNCTKLAEAIAPVMGNKYNLHDAVVEVFNSTFHPALEEWYRKKLGLGFAAEVAEATPSLRDGDAELIADLLATMARTGSDYTNTFRALIDVDILGADVSSGADPVVDYLLTQCASAQEVAKASKPRMPPHQLQMLMTLAQRDPRYVDSIDEIRAELKRWETFEQLSRRTDAEKQVDDRAAWVAWLQKYRARLSDEVPSAVREAHAAGHAGAAPYAAARANMMRRSNPKYVLRNWIAQEAISKAEAGDFSEVQRVYERLQDPYGLADDATADVRDAAFTAASAAASASADTSSCGSADAGKYACKPPLWALDLKVT